MHLIISIFSFKNNTSFAFANTSLFFFFNFHYFSGVQTYLNVWLCSAQHNEILINDCRFTCNGITNNLQQSLTTPQICPTPDRPSVTHSYTSVKIQSTGLFTDGKGKLHLVHRLRVIFSCSTLYKADMLKSKLQTLSKDVIIYTFWQIAFVFLHFYQ